MKSFIKEEKIYLKYLKIIIAIMFLVFLISTPVSSELITGDLQGVQGAFSWGDGVNDLFQTWSVNLSNSSGWFYGSSFSTSNADVYVYPGLDDPTTIADASVFDYWDSSSKTYPTQYGLSWSAWAQEGDTVFFRGVNGKYGAWQIVDIDSAALYGTWYFLDDGTSDFTGDATNYTLTYTVNANGAISGDSPQTISRGGNGTAVTAVPSTGYKFVQWSDGVTDNPRTDTNVTSDITVTALFAVVGDVNIDGEVNLIDTILSLQVVSGMSSATVFIGADVNNDARIGLAEAIYSLRRIVDDIQNSPLPFFVNFDNLNISNPESISPLKCEGGIYDPWGNKLAEYTNMQVTTNSQSAPYSINLIPSGNPSTTKSGILSSAIVDKILDVSAYNSVRISFWSNSTSNPRINSIHNCDSALDIRYRLDKGAWQHFSRFCGQHKTETSGWRYMDISWRPILTENAGTIEFAFEYYIQNSNGDNSVYYLIDDFKVTGAE